jgi:hypothetical protein
MRIKVSELSMKYVIYMNFVLSNLSMYYVMYDAIHFLSSVTCSMVRNFFKLNRCYTGFFTVFSGAQGRMLYTSSVNSKINQNAPVRPGRMDVQRR